MGSQYSVNGFLNAALRRTGKTLLVEGPTDKQLIHRIIIEANSDKASSSSVDHAGIFNDQSLQGMGNKLKVCRIKSEAILLASHFPRILEVLATLTDREWDEISLSQRITQIAWSPPLQNDREFTTFGHSIENYSFHHEYVTEFIKYYWPELVSPALISEIEDCFYSMLIFAATLSLEISHLSCIGKFGGAMRPGYIDILNNRFYLAPSFVSRCSERQIPFPAPRVPEFNASLDTEYNSIERLEFIKWLPHGHIGDEILWSAVARICLNSGFPEDKVQEVAFGNKKEKMLFSANWLSKQNPQFRPPLDEIVTWLESD